MTDTPISHRTRRRAEPGEAHSYVERYPNGGVSQAQHFEAARKLAAILPALVRKNDPPPAGGQRGNRNNGRAKEWLPGSHSSYFRVCLK